MSVIGGTGHIGTYLSPMLVEAAHEVICISRGRGSHNQPHQAWSTIAMVTADREAEEARGDFGRRVAELGAEVVIDLTCYKPSSVSQLVEALRGRVGHFLHCGTIWVHGHSVVGHSGVVPTKESAPRAPFGYYGFRKLAIETYLLNEARAGFPATVLHPGHLVGPRLINSPPGNTYETPIVVMSPYLRLRASGYLGKRRKAGEIHGDSVQTAGCFDVGKSFLRSHARFSEVGPVSHRRTDRR